MVRARIFSWLKWIAILLSVAALTFFAIRVYDVQRGPSLEVWHTYVPQELSAEGIDKADWKGYLAKEAGIFEDLRVEVSRKLTPSEQVPISRYFEGSPVYPAHFAQDFNRSFVLEPDGAPRGGVLLLRADRFSLQSAPYCAGLPRPRLRRVRDQNARSWHGAGGIDRGNLGRLDGGDGRTRS